MTLSEKEDSYIVPDGKQIASIAGIKKDRVADMNSLFGIAKLLPAYNDPAYDTNYDR